MTLYSVKPMSSFTVGKIQQFPRRSFMPAPQNYLWVIETGIVRTSTYLENGTTVTLGVWGAGDVVGKPLSKADPYEIETLTTVEAKAIADHQWEPTPDLLMSYLYQSELLLLVRAGMGAEEKLLRVLSWLARRFGNEVEQGHMITPKLTHQDLADLVGLTRVTVTRSLNQLEQQKCIQRLSRRLVILKEEKFWHYEI
jgi:CRP-like cAMP-binding protein